MFTTRMKRALLAVCLPMLLALGLAPISPVAAAAGSVAPVTGYAVGAPALAKTTVVVTKAPGRVGRGYTASVTVKTTPARVTCSIRVVYKSGASTAAGLYTKTSDSRGYASWSWKMGTRTTPGSWPVYIACGGTTATTYVRVP